MRLGSVSWLSFKGENTCGYFMAWSSPIRSRTTGPHFKHAMGVTLGLALRLVADASTLAGHPIHGARKPSGEHVADFAPSLGLGKRKQRVVEADVCPSFAGVRGDEAEQPPAPLREPRKIVLEHG